MKNKHIKILLVDDDADILEIVGFNLENEGFQVRTASNGKEALKEAKQFKPHLIILDVMMPEMDGVETCENLRKIPELESVLITFLTARSEDYSQMAGFEVGADDYITKPIKPKLLLSKVKALLRRIKNQEDETEIWQVGNMKIERDNFKITREGEEFILPKKEFKLFCLLASKPGKIYSREEILDRVWGSDVVVGGRTIDVHIRKLREKLGDHTIRTIKGVGYKLEI